MMRMRVKRRLQIQGCMPNDEDADGLPIIIIIIISPAKSKKNI